VDTAAEPPIALEAPLQPALRTILLGQGGDETAPGIRGHLQVEELLRTALGRTGGADPVPVRLGPWSTAARVAGGRWPLLHALGLDAHDLRWHLTEATRGRRRLLAALAEADADAIHVHSHVVALGLARMMAERAVFLSVDATIADWRALAGDVPRSLAPARRLERRVLERAAGVLAWTEWARAGVLRAAPGADVTVLHPGVDTERITPGERAEGGRPLRILFVGGRFEDKGGHELIAAAAEAGAELDLVTPVELPARPGVRVHRLAAASPQLLELYRRADVFCLPTERDAAPLAVLEGMAAGLPVVAGDVAGIPELLDGGRCGILVPPRSVRELRQALEALGDPGRRRALGAAGRARAVGRYDSHRQATRLADLIRDRLGAAATAPRTAPARRP
jgi:glycosyltransferase involved in cell wall biosynthesis